MSNEKTLTHTLACAHIYIYILYIYMELVDKFTYSWSSVSSTKTDINTRLAKAWAANDRLSVRWRSDLTHKMKRSFFQAAVVSILQYGCTTWTRSKKKSLKAITQECCEQYQTSPGGNTPKSSSCTATNQPSRKVSKLDEPVCGTLLEKQGRAHK